MAKLFGYKKLIKWIRVGDNFIKASTETRAESVIMDNEGTTLVEKFETHKPATAGNADTANVANSVEWTNVENKPETFKPETHTHSQYSTATFSYDETTQTLTITNN